MLRATGNEVYEAFIRMIEQFGLRAKHPLKGTPGKYNRMNTTGMVCGYFFTGIDGEHTMVAAFRSADCRKFEFHSVSPIKGVPMEERDNSRGGYRYKIQFNEGAR